MCVIFLRGMCYIALITKTDGKQVNSELKFYVFEKMITNLCF